MPLFQEAFLHVHGRDSTVKSLFSRDLWHLFGESCCMQSPGPRWTWRLEHSALRLCALSGLRQWTVVRTLFTGPLQPTVGPTCTQGCTLVPGEEEAQEGLSWNSYPERDAHFIHGHITQVLSALNHPPAVILGLFVRGPARRGGFFLGWCRVPFSQSSF